MFYPMRIINTIKFPLIQLYVCSSDAPTSILPRYGILVVAEFNVVIFIEFNLYIVFFNILVQFSTFPHFIFSYMYSD